MHLTAAYPFFICFYFVVCKEPSGEECGAGSGFNSDRAAGTIPSRKRKITASRSVTEEDQGKRQRLPGNDGPEAGGMVEGTEVGEELSDTDTDMDMDQAEGEVNTRPRTTAKSDAWAVSGATTADFDFVVLVFSPHETDSFLFQ